jgi:PKD repeat protein
MRKYLLSMILLVLFLMPTALAAGNVKINDFSANVTNGTIPLHTRFTGDATGNVTIWRWIFVNEGTGATTFSGANITTHHNFGKPGVYDVTLKVWGPNGNDTLTKTAYVNAIAVTAEPVTAATAKPSSTVTTKPNNYNENDYSGNDYSGNDYSGNDYSGNDYSGNDYSGNDYSGNEYSGNEYSGNDYSENGYNED